jgi:hypothetical protein
MARPQATPSTVKNPIPIKVTVYKLKPKITEVGHYYYYNFGPKDEAISVESCPGCGKHLKYNANEHHCKGPLIKAQTPQTKEQQFEDYIKQLKHPVYFSD